MIDWSDETCQVSKFFTVKEAVWLPTWNRLAVESDGLTDQVKQTIADFLNTKMDLVREFLNAPMHVHCCYRPPVYNQLVGGSAKSAHMALRRGLSGAAAIDFDIGESCDLTRAKLLPELASRGLRMENNPGSSWIHLDCSPPNPNRFFKP